MGASLGVANIFLRMDSSHFKAGMHDASTKVQSLVGKIDKLGQSLISAGTKFALAGAALTIPFALSVKFAIDAESAFTGVRKTVELTEKGFKKLENRFIKMSKIAPTTFIELSKIGEIAGQLGIKGVDNIAKFTRSVADIAVTTNLTAENAATSFARISNIMGEPIENVDRMASAVVDLGNNFATTEAEITTFATRMAGAGRIAGLATVDLFSIGTAMSSVGIEAEAGGTAVQKVLIGINTSVATSSQKLVTFARTAGLSASQFANLWKRDAADAFRLFVEGLGRQGGQAAVTLEELGLNNQRLIRAFLSLGNAGDLLSDTLRRGRIAFAENTALTIESKKRYNTLASQLSITVNRINSIRKAVGEALTPALASMNEKLGPILENFEVFIKRNPALIQALAEIGPTLAAIGIAAIVLGAALKGVAATLLLMSGPIGFAVVAVAVALSAAYIALRVAIKKLGIEAVAKEFDKAFTKIKDAFEDVKDKVQESFEDIKDKVQESFEDIKESFENVKDKLKPILEDVIKDVRKGLGKVVDIIIAAKNLISENWGTIVDIFTRAKDQLSGLGGQLRNALSGPFERLRQVFNDARTFIKSNWDQIKRIFDLGLQAIGTTFDIFIVQIFPLLVRGMVTALAGVTTGLTDAFLEMTKFTKTEGKNTLDNLETLFTGLNGALEDIQGSLQGLNEAVDEDFLKNVNAIGEAVQFVATGFGLIPKAIDATTESFDNFLLSVLAAFVELDTQMRIFVENFGENTEKFFDDLARLGSGFGETIRGIFRTLRGDFDGFIEVMFQDFTGFTNTFDLLLNPIPVAFRKAWNRILEDFDAFKTALTFLINPLAFIIDKINPFHRESPSLVDNVRKGMKEVARIYSDAGKFITQNFETFTDNIMQQFENVNQSAASLERRRQQFAGAQAAVGRLGVESGGLISAVGGPAGLQDLIRNFKNIQDFTGADQFKSRVEGQLAGTGFTIADVSRLVKAIERIEQQFLRAGGVGEADIRGRLGGDMPFLTGDRFKSFFADLTRQTGLQTGAVGGAITGFGGPGGGPVTGFGIGTQGGASNFQDIMRGLAEFFGIGGGGGVSGGQGGQQVGGGALSLGGGGRGLSQLQPLFDIFFGGGGGGNVSQLQPLFDLIFGGREQTQLPGLRPDSGFFMPGEREQGINVGNPRIGGSGISQQQLDAQARIAEEQRLQVEENARRRQEFIDRQEADFFRGGPGGVALGLGGGTLERVGDALAQAATDMAVGQTTGVSTGGGISPIVNEVISQVLQGPSLGTLGVPTGDAAPQFLGGGDVITRAGNLTLNIENIPDRATLEALIVELIAMQERTARRR